MEWNGMHAIATTVVPIVIIMDTLRNYLYSPHSSRPCIPTHRISYHTKPCHWVSRRRNAEQVQCNIHLRREYRTKCNEEDFETHIPYYITVSCALMWCIPLRYTTLTFQSNLLNTSPRVALIYIRVCLPAHSSSSRLSRHVQKPTPHSSTNHDKRIPWRSEWNEGQMPFLPWRYCFIASDSCCCSFFFSLLLLVEVLLLYKNNLMIEL